MIEVPAGNLTLREAAALHLPDGRTVIAGGDAYYLHTMWPILDRFPQLTLADYWDRLTVTEHTFAVAYLESIPDGSP